MRINQVGIIQMGINQVGIIQILEIPETIITVVTTIITAIITTQILPRNTL